MAATNLQNLNNPNQAIAGILQRSRNDWLTAEDWQVLFENRHWFGIDNPTTVPVDSEGLFRVDNHSNKDYNIWRISSRQQKLRNANANVYFNVRFGEGYPNEEGEVLTRKVVRRGGDLRSFVHLRRVNN